MLTLPEWINKDIRPDVFLTVLLPYTPGIRAQDRRGVRDYEFYVSL